MRPKIPSLFLGVALQLAGLIWAAPPQNNAPLIGIQLDELPQTFWDEFPSSEYISYTAIIEFDPQKTNVKCGGISDGELMNLAMYAFDQMHDLAAVYNLKRPNAMAALVHQDQIYFASSVRTDWHPERLISIDKEYGAEGSVGKYIEDCLLSEDWETINHGTGGLCAEPNVIRLLHQHKKSFIKPISGNRIIVVGTNRDTTDFKEAKDPCPSFKGKIGCRDSFKTEYGLNFVKPVWREADPRVFDFSKVMNPRRARPVQRY